MMKCIYVYMYTCVGGCLFTCTFMCVVLSLSCVCVCVYEPATCSGQDSAFLLDNVLGGPVELRQEEQGNDPDRGHCRGQRSQGYPL